MIQFNLLPDVKAEFIKAHRIKRMVVVIASLSVAASLGLLIIMFSAVTLQKRHVSDLNKDIKSYDSNLQNTPDIAKILTIQNQLNSLPDLYAKRPAISRLFGYIQQTTPTQLSIGHIAADMQVSTLTVRGSADTLESVNRYVDTLKFTTYSVKGDTGSLKAFTDVVLKSFSRDTKDASYTVTLSFAPDIFNSSKEVTLNVPKTITTRSETQLPGSSIFDTKVNK